MIKAKIDYAALSLDDVVSPSEMTVGQIITEFRQAKDRKYTLQALADQVCCTVDDMKELLISHGVKPVEMPRARRKKEPVENFRGGGGTSTRSGTDSRGIIGQAYTRGIRRSLRPRCVGHERSAGSLRTTSRCARCSAEKIGQAAGGLGLERRIA